MPILNEQIVGTRIINEVQSSNLVRSEYDTVTKKMIVEFKNGLKYEYEEVPHTIYTRFRLSESQGKFFNTEISSIIKAIQS